jgi:hypothetical protein
MVLTTAAMAYPSAAMRAGLALLGLLGALHPALGGLGPDLQSARNCTAAAPQLTAARAVGPQRRGLRVATAAAAARPQRPHVVLFLFDE